MPKNIEIEYKNLVTNEQFHSLLTAFKLQEADFFSQTNHYFDTEDFTLKARHSALRLRALPEAFELTLKSPSDVGLLETNQAISNEEAQAILQNGRFPQGEILDELKKIKISVKELENIGTLTTKRAEITYRNGLLVFDHSFYLGEEDFEIEYEVKDPESGIKTFHNLLKRFNIPIQTADNKIVRLYTCKLRQSKQAQNIDKG